MKQNIFLLGVSTCLLSLLLVGCGKEESEEPSEVAEKPFEEKKESKREDFKTPLYEDLTQYDKVEEKKEPQQSITGAEGLEPSENADFDKTAPWLTPFVLRTRGDSGLVVPYEVYYGEPLVLNGMTLTVVSKETVQEVEGLRNRGVGFYKYVLSLKNNTGKTFKSSWYSLVSHRDTNGYLHAPATLKSDKGLVLTIYNTQTKQVTLYFQKITHEDVISNLVFHTTDYAIQVQWAKQGEMPKKYETITKSYANLTQEGYTEIDVSETDTFKKEVAYKKPPETVKKKVEKKEETVTNGDEQVETPLEEQVSPVETVTEQPVTDSTDVEASPPSTDEETTE